MEIFGIGPMELILILIIAMMIFGPDKLPELGAKLGRALRDMRAATREFSQEIEQTKQALEAPLQEISAPVEELTQPLQDAKETVATIGQVLTNPGGQLRDSVMRNLGLSGGDADASHPESAAEAASAAPLAYSSVALETPEAATATPAAEPTAPEEAASPAVPLVPEDQLALPFTDLDTTPGAEPSVETAASMTQFVEPTAPIEQAVEPALVPPLPDSASSAETPADDPETKE